MRTVIIDDEPRAIQLLEQYLGHFTDFRVVATFRHPLRAFEYLQREPVDLILLDINMPHLSGLSLARMIDPATPVIFTTAYAEFAVESYEVDAVDYLLKPISLERFARAITKVLAARSGAGEATTEPVLMVKSGNELHRVPTASIRYLEKDGNYLSYYLDDDRRILARATTAEALAELPSHFVRVHKSFIVNVEQVDMLRKEELLIAGVAIPIASRYREALLRLLGKV